MRQCFEYPYAKETPPYCSRVMLLSLKIIDRQALIIFPTVACIGRNVLYSSLPLCQLPPQREGPYHSAGI